MDGERRKNERHYLFIDCAWSAGYRSPSRITDLSLDGCYVDSQLVPAIATLVTLSTTLQGRAVVLHGRVVHARTGMGFAVEFVDTDEATLELLRSTLATFVALSTDPQGAL